MNAEKLPLISVIIPTFNHRKYLGKAIDSIIKQKYQKFEIIVIDNNSTDGTDLLVKKYIDSRITHLKINNNGVIAASRNMGIKSAKGEWIAFLDSDDWWTSDKLQKCVERINDKVDLIYHPLKIVYSSTNLRDGRLKKSWQLRSPVTIDLLLNGNPIANSSVLVRKSILTKINGLKENFELITVEDYDTWIRASRVTENFLYLPYFLGYYLVHDKNNSERDVSLKARFAINPHLILLNKRQKEIVEANLRYWSASFSYRIGDYTKARDGFIKCLFLGKLKTTFKAILFLIIALKHMK